MKTKLEELNPKEVKILEIIEPLFNTFGGFEISETLMARYAEELNECYSDEFQLKKLPFVIKKCIRTCKRFPSIADVLEVGGWEDFSKMRY